jgi:hypothetical protein
MKDTDLFLATFTVVKLSDNAYKLTLVFESGESHVWDLSHEELVRVLTMMQAKYGKLEIIGQEYLQ